MLSISTHKNRRPGVTSPLHFTTKKISLSDTSSCVFQLYTEKDYVANRIENLIVDSLLTQTNNYTPLYNSFQSLLEKLNRELTTVSKDDPFQEFGLFIALVEEDTLHFSLLGNYTLLLVKGYKVVNVGNDINVKEDEFSYISSGKLAGGDVFFATPSALLHFLTEEDVIAIAGEKDEAKRGEIIKKLFEEEQMEDPLDVIIIENPEATPVAPSVGHEIGETLLAGYQTAKEWVISQPFYHKARSYVLSKIDLEQKEVRLGVFWAGALVCVILLYTILSSLLGIGGSSVEEEKLKNMLIESQQYIEKASKDFANKNAFNDNILKGENILYEVRKNQKFSKEVDKQLNMISLLKKQFYGIQSFSLNPNNAILTFLQEEGKEKFNLVNLFELDKKFYAVGKNEIIGPYVQKGDIKKSAYPDGEEAISADMTQDGIIYVLTKTHRVLRFYKGEFKYVNVEGQKTWESASVVRTFNGNLYLLGTGNKQIYKHKPGVSGFAAKSAVIPDKDLTANSIIDFGLDGGIYVVKDNLLIDKIFTTPNYTRNSIVLNKLPDNYTHKEGAVRLIANQNLFYTYVLLNNTIWIFDPKTRNYKDVKSFEYVGQLEPTKATIHSIYVPRDGTVYIGTDDGVYRIEFSSSDGKLIVR